MMKHRNKIKCLNNRGSSLMFVLIAIAFVSILTAVIISAATTNYRLKVMNNRTQKTFYNAEIAVKEVYAGFGKTTCDSLEECYLSISKNLTTQIIIEGESYAVNIDNGEANKQLKTDFYAKMYESICGIGVDTNEYLSQFLTDPSGASVIGHGDIRYKNDDTDKYLVIEDVVISYKEGNYDYFSTVAVDISVTYPDEEFDFISNTRSNLQTFLDYCIIAMDGVNVGVENSTNTKISKGNVVGGVFAGDNGIVVSPNSELHIGIDDNIQKSTIISTGNFDVLGKLTFRNGDLWCRNVNVGSDTVGGASVDFNISSSNLGNTRVYLSDDLSIQGNNCSVSLGEEFFGYGRSGSLEGNLNAGYSSAVIINGRGSEFFALNLNKFVVAGRAFVDFDTTGVADYITADSLGIKGLQKIYLVPSSYISPIYPGSADNIANNPTAATNVTELYINLENFFAYELLNQAAPYRVVTLEGLSYFYLNFSSKEAQKTYVKSIIDDAYFNSNIINKGPNYDADRLRLKTIISSSAQTFTSPGVIDLGLDSTTSFYTEGNLYEVSGLTTSTNTGSSALNNIDAVCSDKLNRFSVLKNFLYDIGANKTSDSTYAQLPNEFYIAGTKYFKSEINTQNAYQRILDTEKLENLDNNYIKVKTDHTIAAVIVEGNYTVPDDVIGGVIVAYGYNVTVNNSFEGLIITDKTIILQNGQGELITDGVRDVASRILDEDLELAQYFLAYQMQTQDGRATSNVKVEDILSFDNWRKNYAN